MLNLFLIIGGIVLLIVAYKLYERQKEQALLNSIKSAGHNSKQIVSEMDRAIQAEQAREEFWKKQNPR